MRAPSWLPVALPSALLLAGALLASPACTGEAAAVPPASPSAEAFITSLAGVTLERYHYREARFDDAASARWLRLYLDALDPNHMIFLASDVEAFERKYGRGLDDTLGVTPADLSPMWEIYRLYQSRFGERVGYALSVLDGPLPVESADSFDIDREEDPWPSSAAAQDALWRQRILSEVVNNALQEKSEDETRDRLRKRYKRMQKDLSEQDALDVLEIWLASMGGAFDPHTLWMKPASKDDFDIQMRDSLQGIGATLQTDGEYTVVKSLVPGGPADRQGILKPGDKIVAVSAPGAEPTDILDLRIDRVVKLIRGPKGTDVILTVLPADAPAGAGTKEVRITRDEVVVAESAAQMEVYALDGVKVALLDIPTFYQDVRPNGKGGPVRSTAADVRRLLTGPEAQGVQVVVLDLRENGGGSLQQAIELTGLFLPTGPVVQVKDRDGKLEVLEDEDASVVWGGPLVVLTSGWSASASEILAGALQDYGRALVVGARKTHGKGTVQQLIDLGPLLGRMADGLSEDTGGALKFTTDQFYRVSGRSTQFSGVAADVVLPSPEDGVAEGEESLPNALPYDEIKPAKVQKSSVAAVVPALQQASTARVAQDPAFQVQAEIRAWREAQDGKPISLSLAARKEERAALEALEAKAKAHRPGDALAKARLSPAPKPPPPPPVAAPGAPAAEPPEAEDAYDAVKLEALRVAVDFVRSSRATR
jgi:carboxyl-terminal processing protease